MNENYKETLKNAEADLAELLVEKAWIDQRVARLRETIVALTRLLSSDEDGDGVQLAEAGLTKSIREVLQEFRKSDPSRYHRPTQIRDRLRARGFSFAGYKNEMAAIHNVLKRLRDLGEVEVGVDAQRKQYYRWAMPILPLTSEKDDLDTERYRKIASRLSKKKIDPLREMVEEARKSVSKK